MDNEDSQLKPLVFLLLCQYWAIINEEVLKPMTRKKNIILPENEDDQAKRKLQWPIAMTGKLLMTLKAIIDRWFWPGRTMDVINGVWLVEIVDGRIILTWYWSWYYWKLLDKKETLKKPIWYYYYYYWRRLMMTNIETVLVWRTLLLDVLMMKKTTKTWPKPISIMY